MIFSPLTSRKDHDFAERVLDVLDIPAMRGHNAAYFLAGEGGLIEPRLLELMRLRGAHLNACTYCATVRLQPVAEDVKGKEAALGVCDISGMTKLEAVRALRDKLVESEFTPREAAAISLVDRIVVDPHSVDDALFAGAAAAFQGRGNNRAGVRQQSVYLGWNAQHGRPP